MAVVDEKVRIFQVESLCVEVHPNATLMGEAAALAAANVMKKLAATRPSVGVIFATGASQLETLEALTHIAGLPWDQVEGLHLDEYVDLPVEHFASFRRYLRENLTQKVHMRSFS